MLTAYCLLLRQLRAWIFRAANERVKQIRQHSTANGDSIRRLAHYFPNGFESHLAGTGSIISGDVVDALISSSDFSAHILVTKSTT